MSNLKSLFSSTSWVVEQPGTIRYGTTGLTIKLLQFDFYNYEISWHDRKVSTTMTLGMAKIEGTRWLNDMIELGYDP